jgi:hypothetical protein
MKKNKFFQFFVSMIIALMASLSMHAQNNSLDQELYQDLHGHGSMNVVFTIIVIILLGLFITLWRIDKKVSRLEKEINERKS